MQTLEINRRRESIYNALVSSGNTVKITDLAQRFNCTEKTIKRDLEFLEKNAGKIPFGKFTLKVDTILRGIELRLLQVINSDNVNAQVAALRTLADITFKKADFFEKFGLINKESNTFEDFHALIEKAKNKAWEHESRIHATDKNSTIEGSSMKTDPGASRISEIAEDPYIMPNEVNLEEHEEEIVLL